MKKVVQKQTKVASPETVGRLLRCPRCAAMYTDKMKFGKCVRCGEIIDKRFYLRRDMVAQ